VITSIRDARNRNNIKPKEIITLHIQADDVTPYKLFEPLLQKQVNAEQISYTSEGVSGSVVVAMEKDKFFITSEQLADGSVLRADLEKDLAYQKNFLQSVEKKLSNERFVQNAKPEVVELERKKKADAEARIRTIEESLQNFELK
jgi:valyl-tRNA synthetase